MFALKSRTAPADTRRMVLMALEDVRPGMVLGIGVRNREGQTVLGAGQRLSPPFVARLRSLGYSSVWIDDEATRDIPYEETLSEETRRATSAAVAATFTLASREARKIAGGSAQEIRVALEDQRVRQTFTEHGLVDRLASAVDQIVRDVDKRAVLTGLSSLRTHSASLYYHSLDVAVTATMIGRILGYDRKMLSQLATGCLLHDIGTLFVDATALNKPARLSESEFRRLTEHTTLGYALIRDTIRAGAVAAHVAYQHHEWQDGSGYPRGLVGTNRLVTGVEMHLPGRITPVAEIAAIADFHDACLSDRPHRPRMAADMAWYATRHAAGTHLNRAMVDAFLRVLPRYPVGTPVEVLDGRWRDHIGVVVRVPHDAIHRPLIRILSGPHGERITPVDVDLRKDDAVICGYVTSGVAA